MATMGFEPTGEKVGGQASSGACKEGFEWDEARFKCVPIGGGAVSFGPPPGDSSGMEKKKTGWAPGGACAEGQEWDPFRNDCVPWGTSLTEPEEPFVPEDIKRRQDASKVAIEQLKGAEASMWDIVRDYDPYIAGLERDIKRGDVGYQSEAARAAAPIYAQMGMGGLSATPAAASHAAALRNEAQRVGAAQLRQLEEDLANGHITQDQAAAAAHDVGVQVQKAIMEQPGQVELWAEVETDIQTQWANIVASYTGGKLSDNDEGGMFEAMGQYLDSIEGLPGWLRKKWDMERCRALHSTSLGGAAAGGRRWCQANGYAIG